MIAHSPEAKRPFSIEPNIDTEIPDDTNIDTECQMKSQMILTLILKN